MVVQRRFNGRLPLIISLLQVYRRHEKLEGVGLFAIGFEIFQVNTMLKKVICNQNLIIYFEMHNLCLFHLYLSFTQSLLGLLGRVFSTITTHWCLKTKRPTPNTGKPLGVSSSTQANIFLCQLRNCQTSNGNI